MSSLLICKRITPSFFGIINVFVHHTGVQRCTFSAVSIATDRTNCPTRPQNGFSTLLPITRRFVSRNTLSNGQNEKSVGDRSVFYSVLGITALLSITLGLRWYLGKNPPDWKPKDQSKNLPPDGLNGTTDLQSVSRSGLVVHGKSTFPSDAVSTVHDEPSMLQTSVRSSQEVAETLSERPAKEEVAICLPLLEEEDSELPSLVYKDESKLHFPSHVQYLIVGAGTAGLSAARSIRATDPKSKVLMVSGGSNHLVSEPGIAETNFVEPPPYLRPPLSKELWLRDKVRESSILRTDGDIRRHSWLYYEAESFYLKPEDLPSVEYGGVALLRGDPVAKLDPDSRTATLVSGRTIKYERCLLATGGRPKRLKHLELCGSTGRNLLESGSVSYFRSLADYKRLRDLADKLRETGGKIAVIGGGFLGSELTVSLLSRPMQPKNKREEPDIQRTQERTDIEEQKLSVLHVFRESLPMGHTLPPCLSSATARFEEMQGAHIWSSSEVVCASAVPVTSSSDLVHETAASKTTIPGLLTATAKEPLREKVRLRIRQSGFAGDRVEEVDVDHVVLAIGVEPNTDLSDQAGLEVDHTNGGFLVNAEMEARAGVYAAGDAASYWDPVLGYRRRVEHLNFAEETGSLAGRNMAASLSPSIDDSNHAPARYHYQSSFWSSLGPGISWDAVGYIDSRRLLTRSFFLSERLAHKNTGDSSSLGDSIPDSEFGHLSRGVVFYLTPSEKRLVGILLWNMPEEIYLDKEYTAPSRLNIARNLLTEKHVIGKIPVDSPGGMFETEDEQLRCLASYFDLPGVLEEDYAEFKSYTEGKRKEISVNSPTSFVEQESATSTQN